MRGIWTSLTALSVLEFTYASRRLLALGLDLPEDTLVSQHKFEDVGESSGEALIYLLNAHLTDRFLL